MQQLHENFWNIRGSFKIAKIFDIGTQTSLVRKRDGSFILIDSYGIAGSDREKVLGLTDNGAAIDTIINVHPFHTLHCAAAHDLAPHARLFGTRRHHEKAPELPWEQAVIEDAETQAQFNDLEFSIPAGLDLVTNDKRVHAASVLVRHRQSGIVHVDDTLMVLAAPGALGRIFPQSRLHFHPMLGKALQHRPGAADAFIAWAQELAERWYGAPYVCAAHSAVRHLPTDGWRTEVTAALAGIWSTLQQHRTRYG